MRHLDVRIRLPDWMLHPMQEFIRYEDVVRYEELIAWSVRPQTGVEYELFYVEADADPYREAVSGVDSIVEYEIEPIDADSMYVWACQETRPEDRAWRSAFADRHLVVVPPVRFDEDAGMTMTVVGEPGDMHELLGDVPDDVDATVEEVGTYDRRGGTVAGTLTDRQLDALETALDAGYYEVPREASLDDVAAALECTQSTASELIRRAERAVFSRVFERYGGSANGGRGRPSRGGDA